MKKSKIYFTFIVIFFLFILFDIFFCFTNFGAYIHGIFRPPVLYVESYPSKAYVTLKGKNGAILKEDSITPFRIYKIEQGNYTLILKKHGYTSVKRNISISGTTHPLQITIPLETTIVINSYPAGADVFVDNKKLEKKTPVTVEYEVSKKNIRLEKQGSDLITIQCCIDLAFPVDQQEDLDPRFWKLYAATHQDAAEYHLKGIFWKKISIDSKPQGADVYIDNKKKPIGKTRINEYAVPAGQHSFRFAMQGFQSKTEEVFINEDIVPAFKVNLNKIIAFNAYDSKNPGHDINAYVTIPSAGISDRLTPCTVDLPAEKFTAVFSKEPGYKKVTKIFDAGSIDVVAVSMKQKDSSVEITVIEKKNQKPVPNAEVSLDSKFRGTTDTAGRWNGSLAAGRHVVVIDTKGRFPVKEKIIDCGSTGRELVTVHMTPATDGTLVVDTRPHFIGAKIFVDGSFAGETMRKLAGLERDAHVVSVKHMRLAEDVQTTIMLKKKQHIILKMDENGKFYTGE